MLARLRGAWLGMLMVTAVVAAACVSAAPDDTTARASVTDASPLPTYPPIPFDPIVRVPRTDSATGVPETTELPQPATAAPQVPQPAPRATPVARAATTCPATWFCYPRLGIAGAIVPYSDCTGQTDIGTSIRAYLCLSPFYLMGHAYTQMGKLTSWRAGDVVYAYGRPFTVYSAYTQQSCERAQMPLAPLSMQTSLTPYACQSVLVVQAR